MLIRDLHILNFRNLKFVRAEFAPGLNVIYGSNAQGKTNLLESIYMLVTGRSFRTQFDREIVPWLRDEYEATVVRACVDKNGMQERYLLSFNQAEKHLAVNGEPIRRLGDLIGRVNAVLFTPVDLQLVRGGPGVRRRFLDIELSQLRHEYLAHLQRYDLALRQRNALLRQQRRQSLSREIEPWDQQLAEHGAEIARFRVDVLTRLSSRAAEMYHRIANRSEALQIVYHPSPSAAADTAGDALRNTILASLRSGLESDIRRQQTSVGPHRDDFSFLIEGRSARDFGSQGQQRSCVLAARLAELGLMQDFTGEYPILLLDDLMSELDRDRKAAFFEALEPQCQTFMTVTEKEQLSHYTSPSRIFRMEGGVLELEA